MIYLKADFSSYLASEYSIFVKFEYNPAYVQIIKSLKTRVYIPDTKTWEVSWNCFTELISTLNSNNIPYNGKEFQESIDNLKIAIDKSKAIQETNIKVDTSKLQNIKFKTTPRSYQLEGIAYGLQNPRFLLADEQGLGKSLQALNIATLDKQGKHCLIIVGYDILQFNWVSEIEKHTHEKGYVLGQKEITRGKNKGTITKDSVKSRIDDLLNIDSINEYFIVTSVATLRHSIKQKYKDKNGKEKVNKVYAVANIIEDLCQKGIIGRIIFDEGQVVKSIDTDQTKALLKIKSCPHKIIATGTPIMNKHIDLYPIMSWLGYEKSSYFSFQENYCIMGGFKNKQIIGNKNSESLNKKLSRFMLRRKKDSVLDLPEKIIIDEVLNMDLKQQTLYNKTKGLLKQRLATAKGNKAIILSMLIELRKITSHPGWIDEKYKDSVKFERIHFLMKEITDNNQKAIIFSNWATPINKLKEELAIYNPAVITGETKDRMQQVEKFQNDNNCKVILGTIGAMGTGITLTAASNVIFLDEPWNRALKDQATDRAHRIGTKNNVNIYTLICKDTIDEKVHNTVVEKGKVSDLVLGDLTAEELEELLKDSLEF